MSIEIDIRPTHEALGRLMTMNLQREKDLRALIRSVLRQARKEVSQSIRGEIANDPRKAYQAVRHSVYKRIFGGQVNILNGRRGRSAQTTVNRSSRRVNRTRSADTIRREGYTGKQRGFILRFLNAGVSGREVLPGRSTGRGSKATWGYRGGIGARRFFGPASTTALERAAEQLDGLITRAIEEVWTES